MVFLYNLVLYLAAIVALPFVLVGLIFIPRWRAGLWKRLGWLTFELKETEKPCLWLHAASLGEVRAVSLLVAELKKMIPQATLVMSATTASGYKEALKLQGVPAGVTYLPLELNFVVRRVVKKLKPAVLVLVETELWPNLILQAKARGAKIMVVNGRFSQEAAKRYMKFKKFFKLFCGPVDLWAMRSEEDRQYALNLGVDPDRVQVTGNIKFQPGVSGQCAGAPFYRSLFHDAPVLACGSTRPGEEEIILEAFRELKTKFPELKLVLAPRHLERVSEVAALLGKKGFDFERRSEIKEPLSKGETLHYLKGDVLLLDTYGELLAVYQVCQAAFVGGTLLPFGGHNVLEPAACGKPVLFGPYTDHFHDEAKLLLDRGVGFLVKDADSLALQAGTLLNDAGLKQAAEEKAKEIFQEKQGIVQKNARLIAQLWKEAVFEKK